MLNRKISANHSAKMRKVCDTLVSSKNSAEQFKKRVEDYEHDRWLLVYHNNAELAEGEERSRLFEVSGTEPVNPKDYPVFLIP